MLVRIINVSLAKVRKVRVVCLGRQSARIRSQKNARSCDQFHFLLASVRPSNTKFQTTKNNQSPSLVDFVEPLFAFRLLAMQPVATCYIHTYMHTYVHTHTVYYNIALFTLYVQFKDGTGCHGLL